MKILKTQSSRIYIYIVLAILLYTAGAFLIPQSDKEASLYRHNTYTTYDYYGGEEERESTNLIRIKGIGPVLTYRNIYLSVIAIILPSVLCGAILFGQGKYDIECIVLAKCIIGVLLIFVTTRSTILPTILFWCGSICGFQIVLLDEESS